MLLNKAFTTSCLFLSLSTASIFCFAQDKKKSRIRPVLPYNHSTLNAPPNMVYVRGGTTTMKYNQSASDTSSLKKVSLTSFFMDKTEITNSQYRKFTEWVIDSIAIYKYLDDESYFIGYNGDSSMSTTNRTASSITTDTTTKEIAEPADIAPAYVAVADSEVTYDSVVVDNTPEPVIKEDVKNLFNKALKGITFETAKDLIRPSSFPVLDEVVVALRDNPTYTIQINGHTDNQGKAASNQVLSQKRAVSVKNYLVSKGIGDSRIRTAGYGGERPIADNTTAEGREKNRRVEFIADLPNTVVSTPVAGAPAPKKTHIIKVRKMVMRHVRVVNTTVSNDSYIDTTKSFDASRKHINWAIVNHKKIFSEDNRKKLAPLLDEFGNIRTDKYWFRHTYTRMSNTVSNSRSRKLQDVNEVINIYPEETVWAEDLTNSQTDLLVENYFKSPPYDDYPVVGVTWKQARAYCYWRSVTATPYENMPEFMKYYRLVYTLPSEAQWSYASSAYYDMIMAKDDSTTADSMNNVAVRASADTTVTAHDSAYVAAVTKALEEKRAKANKDPEITITKEAMDKPPVDSTPIHYDESGMLSNFKQEEGDYWEDGAALTVPVMAYAPNEFGIYNMEGNVSEWVMDAYSPSTFAFVSDLNPTLLYDAEPGDAEAMRRKVIRGGSFISNAKGLGANFRDMELDNVAHCYIGFRCTLMAPEVLYRPVQTRKTRVVGHSANKVTPRHIAKK